MNRRTWLAGASMGWALPVMAGVEKVGGKPRLRSALCAYSFRTELQKKTLTYEDLVRMAVDWNIDGLDLTVYWFPSNNDDFLLPLRRLAYRHGVELYSISIRSNFCQPAPDLQEKELVELKKWVDVANKLGAGHIRVFGGTVPKGRTDDEAAGWVASILKRGAEYAGTKGIILGLENHGGITAKAERIVDIVKQVDSPWVGVNLDTGNFQDDAYNQLAICLPYSANVQVKENIRVNGAQEKSDWARIAGMLRKAGYKGYLALEYEEKEPAPTAVPRLLAKLRQVIGQS
ncbi:MAG: sugar phosphate isomerase/epimerase [Acidobacteria bacterium]|nr:sugar phosphate isomerase/epimerase [Acidobacteriota bacterium]